MPYIFVHWMEVISACYTHYSVNYSAHDMYENRSTERVAAKKRLRRSNAFVCVETFPTTDIRLCAQGRAAAGTHQGGSHGHLDACLRSGQLWRLDSDPLCTGGWRLWLGSLVHVWVLQARVVQAQGRVAACQVSRTFQFRPHTIMKAASKISYNLQNDVIN